jgi:hypothetical protein
MRTSQRPLRASGALLTLLLLAGALPLAGCDEEGLDLDGEHISTVSGDVDVDYTGRAYYTTFDNGDGPVFVLLFFRGDLADNDEDEYAYVALWRQGARPGTGVYAVNSQDTAPTAFAGSYTDLVNAESAEASGPTLSATDGVLSITDVDTGRFTGSFRFDGQGLFLPDTDEFIAASVDGTFEARYIQPGLVLSLPIDFAFD